MEFLVARGLSRRTELVPFSLGASWCCQVGIRIQWRVNDRRIGGLPLVVGAEDQRMLSKSPSAAVAEAPEWHAFHGILMLAKNRDLPVTLLISRCQCE